MGRESKIKKLRREGILEPVRIDKKRASTLKKIFVWVPAILVSFAIIFGFWAYTAKDTEATVNGRKITSQKVEEMLFTVKQNMKQQNLDPESKDQQANIMKYRNDIVQMLIDQKIFETYSEENKIKVDEKDLAKKVQDEIDNMKKQFPNEQAFLDQLLKSGLRNLDSLKKEIDKSIRPQSIEEASLKPIYDKIIVTEQIASDYFYSPSQVTVKRILKKAGENTTPDNLKKIQAEIEDIRKKLSTNELSFDKAIETYSEDETKSTNKGSITLYEGAYPNEPELFLEAKKLAEIKDPKDPKKIIMEVSQVFKTKEGFNILQLVSKAFTREKYNKPESAEVKEMIIKGSPSTASEDEKSKSKLKAEGLAKTLQAGKEKFDVIADSYSENKDQAKTAKTIYRGGQDPAIDTAVFTKLVPGKISDALVVGENFEIIQLIAKHPAEKAVFEKIKVQVIGELTQTKKTEARSKWLEEQRKKRNPSIGNPWNRMVSFYDSTLGAFFQDLGNWIRQYTVEPAKPVTPANQANQINIPGNIGDGTSQDVTIPVEGSSIPVPPPAP